MTELITLRWEITLGYSLAQSHHRVLDQLKREAGEAELEGAVATDIAVV